MRFLLIGLAALALSGSVLAKLPAPSDEAKAKAAEAAAKTAHAGKVDAYLLCKAQDRVVARTNKAAAKAASTCVDPGPFVYVPAGAASAPAAVATAPAPGASPAKK